jgi:hypothetical protein
MELKMNRGKRITGDDPRKNLSYALIQWVKAEKDKSSPRDNFSRKLIFYGGPSDFRVFKTGI